METKQDWARLIEDYFSSGLTQKSFCLGQKVDLEQFKWRLRQYRKGAVPVGGFVRLPVAVPAATPSSVELHLPGGLFLRFPGDVGPGYLREFIAGLGS